MSYIGSFTRRIFGHGNQVDPSGINQNKEETFAATTSRVMKGPRVGGHFSFHAKVGAGAGGPAGALTVWYSNLPNPNPDTDADWVQDSAIASID